MIDAVTIDVVSDVVCPWCYIGKRRLEAAMASVPDVKVNVRWRPYQLDPTIPAQGKDRREYMLGKFGSEDRIKQIHANIVQLGAIEGISFDFDAIKVAPNTLDAHRVIRWAASAGEDVQNRLVGILFSAYFEQGQNIGDPTILLEAAQLSGMDVSVVETLLPSDADREAVQMEIATASRMGITGVPCFLLEGKYAVMGAQESAVLADAIRQVAQEKASAEA
ncbi:MULTISPECIES: DsbA family oxidoreductase [Mesorhizobium]|uniref:DsbA family protein n=1 Tax=Mesorhizobium denitrificans TaxID=2294114 RepID=A0A371X971_9HYPH|nr:MULTISPECIES: DsbA family protein [Mesorhizobium]RFC65604.1 DsbA family protein [Mesorhizobium denitrificans]